MLYIIFVFIQRLLFMRQKYSQYNEIIQDKLPKKL